MAVETNAAAGNRLDVDVAPVSGVPVTMACWFNASDATSLYRLPIINDKDLATASGHWFALLGRGDVVGDPVHYHIQAGVGSIIEISTTTGYTANMWHHACSVSASATSHAVYLDGGGKGTLTTSRSPTGLDYFAVGVLRYSTSSYFGGSSTFRYAHVAVWNAGLVDDEVAALAAGFSPLCIRPESLVTYCPLGGRFGRGDYKDIMGLASLSTPGSVTDVDFGQKVIYPASSSLGLGSSASPPAADFPYTLLHGGLGIA